MVDVSQTEPERRAAIEEVTRLRRKFDTTTAKGAKAFAADPAAQAALSKLDAAKSAAGMRTSAQDLSALNRLDAGPKTEKQVTQALNQPSQQYFKQVKQKYKSPEIPNWSPSKKVTPQEVAIAEQKGVDLAGARYDWVWNLNSKDPNKGQWGVSLIGTKLLPPKQDFRPNVDNPVDYGLRAFGSEQFTVGQWYEFINQNNADTEAFEKTKPLPPKIDVAELAEELPDITYSQIQEIIYRLTLERDNDITIEDLLDKYDELFGEG
jgi:hypothetical protein